MADPSDTKPVNLLCLRGNDGPPDLGEDLLHLLGLPKVAREGFWEVLGAYLKPVLDDDAQTTIVNFCQRHDLSSEQIAPIVKGTRFLFQESARANLSAEEFTTDIHALVPEDEARDLCALLLPWLEDFLPKLRTELVRQTIADHGKLVVGSHWRLDRVTRSDRGEQLDAPVAAVTFQYRDGTENKRITLHMLVDQVDALREAATEMLA